MKFMKFLLPILLAAPLFVSQATAADSSCSASTTGHPKCPVGNPIDVMSGNKFQHEVDLPALPGVMGLEIVRYYNSDLSGIGSKTGILGRGWRLSYEMTAAAIGDTVQIIEADGHRLIFARDPLHPSLCNSGNPANGEVDVRRTPDGDEYVWRKTDGGRLTFNSHGRLVQILAPTGEFVSMQYDARGWLVTVTDPQRRSLKLNYLDKREGAKGDRFRGVQSIETPVGRFTYGYGSQLPKGSDPAQQRALVANLVQVGMPSGGGRQYHYEDARFPTLLTGISIQGTNRQGKPAMQRFSTYGYDANAKAVLSTHADNVDRVTLDTSVGGQTVLTNSLGQKTVYRYGMIAGEQRIHEVRGAGCSFCGEPNVRYGYDALGRMNSLTWLDHAGMPWGTKTVRYDYYGRPLEIRKVVYRDGKPVSSRQLARLEYAAGTRMTPSLVARPSVVAGREWQLRIRYNSFGQPLERTETGWSPPARTGEPERISRTTTFRYAMVNGRSVLAELDGPLPNGPAKSPADSDITRLSWSEDGSRVMSVEMPGNFRSDFDYDAAGRLAGTQDESGAVSSFSQDAQGRITAMTSRGVRHVVKYDAAGNMVEQGTGEGDGYRAETHYGYDEAGRNTWIASALGILSRFQFDTEDRLVTSARMSSRILQQHSLRYDEFGRPIEIRDQSGARQEVAWDSRDFPAAIRDALGRELQLAYDSDGELARATPAANVTRGPLLARDAVYERDVNGKLKAVTVGSGVTTRYVRDDFGRTTAVISADSGLTSYRYDAAGQLLRQCEADGACANYRYDVAGRLAERTIDDGKGPVSRTALHYAGRRLASVDDAAQSESYQYDARGLLSEQSVTLHVPGGKDVKSSRSFHYDAALRLASASLPDGSEISYVRNGQDQVVAVERSRIRTPWLRWLLPKQTIVSGLERDIVGLRHVRYGNGIEADYQRAKSGALARIVYRREQKAPSTTLAAAERVLGIGEARAAEAKASRPGELGAGALIDHRYWWDLQGNLIFAKDPQSFKAYAYDPLDRLVIAEARTNSDDAQPASVNRYFADGIGNRMLALERGVTSDSRYDPNSSRPPAADQAGRQTGPSSTASGRRYVWQAGGLLAEVWRGNTRLASYRYNHRGERVEKRTASGTSYFLYEDRKVVAELDAQGRVLRQYIYLSDMPVAVLDAGERADAPAVERGAFAQVIADIGVAMHDWFGTSAHIAFLHTNHLGATEAATDEKGAVVWTAEYQPFGRAAEVRRQAGFVMNLRLPGQVEDEETGLYYNDHRYYDPDAGRYISPDPLGLRGGLNSYAYADGNPLRFVDPSGLLLFAFDGTGNSANPDAKKNDSHSNVWKFWSVYDGPSYYITGIGTTDERVKYEGSQKSGDGIKERLTRAFDDLTEYIGTHKDEQEPLTIDVVGFSRGSATARAWLNQLKARLKDGAFEVGDTYRCIDFNFVGLWDTVPHLGYFHGEEKNYNFSIPAEVKLAAHAVALNETRGGLADFDGLSIRKNANDSLSDREIERGFIGAHSDVGGGYATGDLSDVSLMWMVEQARKLKVKIKGDVIHDEGWDVVTNPQIHDSNTTFVLYGFGDRTIHYLDHSSVDGKKKNDGSGMTWADTQAYIHYNYAKDPETLVVGTVNMLGYCEWLNDHGYSLGETMCK